MAEEPSKDRDDYYKALEEAKRTMQERFDAWRAEKRAAKEKEQTEQKAQRKAQEDTLQAEEEERLKAELEP